MKLVIALLASLLSACATDGALTSSAPSTTVYVPTPVACVNEADIPAKPGTVLKPGMSFDQREAAELSDLDAYTIYADQADLMLRKCTVLPKAPQ